MSGWIICRRGSFYGPFPTKDKAVAWAEKKLGHYIGGDWCASELWNPKNID